MIKPIEFFNVRNSLNHLPLGENHSFLSFLSFYISYINVHSTQSTDQNLVNPCEQK